MRLVLAFLTALTLAAPAVGKAVKVITPLPAELIGNVRVVDTTTTLNAMTRSGFAALEAKAAEKRADAKLAPVDATAPLATRPVADEYATLPITRMMPLVVEDKLQERGVAGMREVRLAIELDTFKTANGGMMMLMGSSDQLAGTVSVLDAASGATLGQFYVDVLNGRAGLLGAALRGSGVREKLADEFAKHVADQLAGKKGKGKSA